LAVREKDAIAKRSEEQLVEQKVIMDNAKEEIAMNSREITQQHAEEKANFEV